MAKKARRRNLKTVREIAESKLKARQRPSWFKRLLGFIFKPLGRLLVWLNQPLPTHKQESENPVVAGLTKQRSMLPKYLRLSFKEIKLVTWPTFPKAMRLTLAVLIFTFIFTSIIAGLDWAISRIFEEAILSG